MRGEYNRSNSAKNFLKESDDELKQRSQSRSPEPKYKESVIGCKRTLYTMSCFLILWIFVLTLIPSSSVSIYWDNTILDIETSSVTRTIKADVTNNNWYNNNLSNLYIEEYVRTCKTCPWQLVEEYAQGDKVYNLEGYENVEININSIHKGIEVTKALDISEACLNDSLNLKFKASWNLSGLSKSHTNTFEDIFCEINDPYELRLSSNYGWENDYVPIKEDRIEKIKNNLRISKKRMVKAEFGRSLRGKKEVVIPIT